MIFNAKNGLLINRFFRKESTYSGVNNTIFNKLNSINSSHLIYTCITIEMVQHVDDQLLLSQVAYETHDLVESGSSPNNVHNNIEDKLHLHKRMVRICLHILLLGIRHKFDHLFKHESDSSIQNSFIHLPKT